MSLTDPTVSQNHVLRAFSCSLFDACRFSGAEQLICFYFIQWLTLRSWIRLLFGWYRKLFTYNNYDLYWSSMTRFCKKHFLNNYLFDFADINGNALLPTPSIFKSFGEYNNFSKFFRWCWKYTRKKFFLFVAQAELVILVAVVYPQLFSAILYQFSRADFCKRLIRWNIVTTFRRSHKQQLKGSSVKLLKKKIFLFSGTASEKMELTLHCSYFAKICFHTSA